MAADPQSGPDAEGAPVDDVPMYALGRIGKAHSLDGSFSVTKPKGEHLVQGTIVTVAGVEREIVRRSGTDAKPILRLQGVDGIDEAERLRGTDLFIPRASLPDLDDEEYWPDDLVGLPVRATTGEPVGTLAEVLTMPSVDVLRVARSGAPDLLVPFHREAVPVFDVGARDVAIDLVFLDEPTPAAGESAAGDAPAGGAPSPDADATATPDEG
ncbi:ribosome maturation factor RimM [Patulibacter sp.]|uniref:ribosome maturation factor RimM n=1 Tax=Patulibacter sp. TaxID=1912859 RepID=UPI0027250973|nr:ribosome maturation factor RimM [Patulibacter sp.]MDO9410916.1 ribosome maturation factor RimM [Patulibacter sp.]